MIIKNIGKGIIQVFIGVAIVVVTAVTFSSSLHIADKSNAQATCPAPLLNCVDTSIPNQTGQSINVGAKDDFQQALNKAKFGDTIVLKAGATYKGPFTLPKKTGNGWIIIRTSELSSLPTEGVRVKPSNAKNMPKIITDDSEPAIEAADGANHYRFIGIEIASENKKTSITTSNLVLLGDGSETGNDLPSHIIFDRSYIHGNQSGNMRRALTFNGRHLGVIDSYIADAHEIGADSQAIGGWSGNGPFKVVNNYLEGAGENVLFGGAKAKTGLGPSDLEFRKNYVTKPLAWRNSKWTVKNLLEFKNMTRAYIDGNIFENNWSAAQTGTAILFTPKHSGGASAAVNDITFTNNIVKHASSAFQIMGTDYTDDLYPRQGVQVNRIMIHNNLFDDISKANWDGAGRFVLLTSGPGPNQLTIDHNTVTGSTYALTFDGDPDGIRGFVFTNNTINKNKEVVIGNGNTPGIKSLDEYLASDYKFSKNILEGANSDKYPTGNYYSSSDNSSKSAGVNVNTLNAAIKGVIDGNPSSTLSTPPPTQSPLPPAATPPVVTPSSGGGQVSGMLISAPTLYSDGSLLFDDNVIYVMEYGRKRPFVTMEVFTGLGFKLSTVISTETSAIPEGPGVFTKDSRHPRGVLVNDKGAVYFMGEAQRYGFPSPEVFFSWGNNFQNVVSANPLDRQIPEGPIVQKK